MRILCETDDVNTRPATEQELLQRAQEGDMEAFAQLFETQRKLVFAIAYRLGGANDCDDVVMETFLKAWKALPGFRRQASLRTWLARIASHCALDFRRGDQRRKARFAEPEIDDRGVDSIGKLADPNSQGPAEQAISQDTMQVIEKAMQKLTEPQRATLVLREVDGLSYHEVAAATGVTIGTVMSRLFYAKRRMRKLLQEFFNDR